MDPTAASPLILLTATEVGGSGKGDNLPAVGHEQLGSGEQPVVRKRVDHVVTSESGSPETADEVDRRIRNAWCSFRNYTLKLLLLFSHYADWAGPQPRLWFAEHGKITEGTH